MNTKTKRALFSPTAARFLLLAMLVAAIALTLSLRGREKRADYDQMIDAAARMARMTRAVASYKRERGIPLTAEDIHSTYLLGDAYNFMTTTLGAVEAKRTAAHPDMAALALRIFKEAGVKPGDTIAALFSGSFPGINLAVLAACDELGARLIYTPAVGASTFGANQPELTFPDMAVLLCKDGLIETPPVAYSLGGRDDLGLDMDGTLLQGVKSRMKAAGVPLLYEADYAANIEKRLTLYETPNPVDCFVSVGGNLAATGGGEGVAGQGLLDPARPRITAYSGLIERYLAKGVPVVQYLNIKRLVADYGLPYDPETPPEIGESAIYFEDTYPKWPCAIALLLALLLGARAMIARKRPSPK